MIVSYSVVRLSTQARLCSDLFGWHDRLQISHLPAWVPAPGNNRRGAEQEQLVQHIGKGSREMGRIIFAMVVFAQRLALQQFYV